MKRTEHQRKHFENIADIYFHARKNKNHLHFKKLLWSKFFEDITFTKKKLMVLEPMCGYSEGKEIIEVNTDSKISYEGFDYSTFLINQVQKDNPSLNVYVQDVTSFKPTKRYDIIIVIGGLHHVYHAAQKVLKLFHKALKKDGCIIMFEPTQNNFLFKKIRTSIYNKNDIFDQVTEKAFDLEELNKYFKKSGLKIKKQIYPGLLGYTLYYNPDAFPFLNRGNTHVVDLIFKIEHKLYTSLVGKYLSFATLTLLEKN